MSGLIAVFERNATTGGLERVQRVTTGAGANWIQVVRVA
jgi:6-phosphogluconolactonase (cycloisomerase 2 family)